jgi:hypothetical protein
MDENLFKLMKRIACSLPQVMGALSALTCSLVPHLRDYPCLGTSKHGRPLFHERAAIIVFEDRFS